MPFDEVEKPTDTASKSSDRVQGLLVYSPVVNRRSTEQRLCHKHVRINVAVCYLELNANPKKSNQFDHLIVPIG